MDAKIVQSTEPVTLLGAGAVAPEVLAESLRFAPRLVAADGGARQALALGMMPEAVIGDFDSIDDELRAAIPADRMHHIQEQDSTDFDKALRSIAAPLVLAVGFAGRRLDHELAVYNAMVRHADRPVIALGEEDLCLHLPGRLSLDLPVGTRVSLFPMAELGCRSEGLRWPTDHLTFSPWGRVGTSNEAAAPRVVLEPGGPGMLAIMPRAALEAAIAGLRGR